MLNTITALGEPNRFRIVELLGLGPLPVNDISAHLGLRQPQVSKHLRVLKAAGLVAAQPRAQQRVYALRAEPFHQLHDWLERYRGLWDARFRSLDGLLDELNTQEKSDVPSKRR